jgi:hypothetical protein
MPRQITPNEQKIMGMISQHLDMAYNLTSTLSAETSQRLMEKFSEQKIILSDIREIKVVVDSIVAESVQPTGGV